MRIIFTCMMLCITAGIHAQNSITLCVRSGNTPLPGATIQWKEQNRYFIADSAGRAVISGIPDGTQHFEATHTGFTGKTWSAVFPIPIMEMVLLLEASESDDEEVIVTATRTSRTIANTATRTEVISGEELAEKANMKPGDIRMLLNESTGIQTQQTSATSGNAAIRIQGLDGRYTQVLKDGLPLYAGFAGGLSLLQTVPLDLKQVEVIKGSSSTLYGGGAIAGLVNLVSRTPGDQRRMDLLANVTSAGGLDLSGFYSERYGHTGATVFVSRNTSRAYDPAGNGFSAIPQTERYSVNPRLFLYGKKVHADFGFGYISENRTGGSMDYIRKGVNGYFENNRTRRFTTQADIRYDVSGNTYLRLRNSYNHFRRTITMPSYVFAGLQQSGFTEMDVHIGKQRTEWIAGLNFLTDQFREDHPASAARDYRYTTFGAFVQNTFTVSPHVTVETGLRGDHVSSYGFVLLPRVSAVYKVTPRFTVRAGGGAGYKTPTVFNEDAEKLHFENIQPITSQATVQERSWGTNFDMNYRVRIGETNISINQLFFYTRLNRPLVLVPAGAAYRFENADGHIDTKGFETNIKASISDVKLFTGYTYADVATHYLGNKAPLLLTARHRLNNVLMYEKEGRYKLGLEAYYTGRQYLAGNTTGRPYWIMGFMAERTWGRLTVFINFENFTDTRQTRFESIYTGPASAPVFRDIYAPVDGFVTNGGIKLKW